MGGSVLAPGESTSLEAKVNFKGKRGSQSKKVTIISNDPENPKMVLKIIAQVVADVDVIPKRVDITTTSSRKGGEREVQVVNKGEAPLNITKVTSSNKSFEFKQETVEEGRLHKILVTAVPPFAQTSVKGSVIIRTDHPKYPTISVPVQVRVVSDVVVVPRVINVPDDGRTTTPVSFRLALRTRSGRDFKILGVEPPLDSVKVDVIPLGTNSYRLDVQNLIPSKRLNGKSLLIHTDEEGNEEIRVPIRIFKRQ